MPGHSVRADFKLVDKGFSSIAPAAGFMVVYAAKHGETALDGAGGVWSASRHQQQPFTYGSPPGREDFYFVAGK